ncbi:hypothetical protein HDV05_004398 [Chytridiales sp. JEL 0842]|nr:hypothetical protein HDV05_004398 [Chytridiales sp. JEL 0842]
MEPENAATADVAPGIAGETEPMMVEESSKLDDINAFLPETGLEVEESMIYKWEIPSWSALKQQGEKVHSPEFTCQNSRWRLLLFPTGNKQSDMVSVFLDSVDAATVPKNTNWHICVQFAIILANPDDPNSVKFSTAQHRYNATEADWGFNHHIKQSQLTVPIDGNARPVVENDRTVLAVHMKIMKDVTGVLWHQFTNYDSKKETGYVGLKNQGATCYMNSLLQSLYFTTYFRKATYAIPTENDEPTRSVALALQRVFYHLQHSEAPVGTTELTKSFGWDTLDSFMQHDVQEFNRVLQDNLESKMKGTKAEGAILKLFVGKYKSFIKCINVDYESSRFEDFYDIQMNVKGFKTLRDSFVDYISVETLDGDNKYHAEGYGLQDAKKGVIFTKFPPVLHLQLKRFEYDMMRDAMVKINDRYEFPLEIDLNEFLDVSCQNQGPQKYILHGVLVHSGDLHGGHYCAFLRAEKQGKWFKFDDDRVIPVTEKEVLEENYGGDMPTVKPGMKTYKRFTNAYMLVYIRESDLDEILAPVTEEDIPDHLRRRFEEDRINLEQRRKDKEEQHLYLNVKVLFDEQIKEHRGFDLCNFNDKNYPLTTLPQYKVRKEDTLRSFKEMLASNVSVPIERLRLWTMVGRQNHTVRPDSILPESELDKTLEMIHARYSKPSVDLRLYAEIINPDQVVDELVQGQFVIFLKYYDPVTQKMQYVGNTVVKTPSMKIAEITSILAEKAGLPKGTSLLLFEEIKPEMVDALKLKSSFQAAELGDGDIICFQKEISSDEIEKLPDPTIATVPKYFDQLRNRQVVVFKPKQKERETASPDVEIILSKKMVYDIVVEKLGARLNADPLNIRLSTQGSITSKQFIKRSPTLTLQEMLQTGFYNPLSTPSVLFYEVLDIPLSELEIKRFLKVSFVDAQGKEQGPHDVLVMKTAKASEVIDAFREKVASEFVLGGNIRMYESVANKIHKFFTADEHISTVGDNSSLYIEEIPSEESEMGEGDKIISVCHFSKEPSRGHGIPFRFVLKQGEMFSQTKERLAARSGLGDKDILKAKFVIVPAGFVKPKPIEDGDILSDVDFGAYDYIGIDHVDKSGKSTRVGGMEKAIKIFN